MIERPAPEAGVGDVEKEMYSEALCRASEQGCGLSYDSMWTPSEDCDAPAPCLFKLGLVGRRGGNVGAALKKFIDCRLVDWQGRDDASGER